MNKSMEENIKLNDNIQHFVDVMHYFSPPSKVKYKLFGILAFNQYKYKTILCNLSLIENENAETFITILAHLKNIYNFNPQKISLDFSKVEYKVIINVFSNVIFIPFFLFHE